MRQHRREPRTEAAHRVGGQQHRHRPPGVLTAAIAQIPASFRRDLLITCDGAGATKDLLTHITTLNAAPGRRVRYSVGFDLDHRCRSAIDKVPEAWENVINADGSARDPEYAGVVELTGLLRESAGPTARSSTS
ncbi:MAG: hypothetical protein IPJ14_16800 [Kineosporiaceae bacterium]|nr:hypothetical protein [Kineosporiaceae bacterium]